MYRWNLMLRPLFESRRQQSKARRTHTTMRLHLEVLEDRTLPSASSLPVVTVASPPAVPQVAAITSFVDAMVQQRLQLIATIVQDASTIWNTLGQEIIQEVAALQLQVGHILGIDTNTPTPSSNAAASQPSSDSGVGQGHASGSGSGSGATTTAHENPHPRLDASADVSGSGGGSAYPTYSASATVTGRVWLDNNGDGSIDSTEMDYAGDTVYLYVSTNGGTTWSLKSSTTTSNATQGYNYSLPVAYGYPWPGSYIYKIQVGIPSYFYPTLPGTSQIDAQGYSQTFSLSPGGTVYITGGLCSMDVNVEPSDYSDDPNGPTQQNAVTLRDAIETGNNGGGIGHGSTIEPVTFYLPGGGTVAETINLQAALPDIAESYDIDGPGAAAFAVNANAKGSVYTIDAGKTSTIKGETIKGGSDTNGGGILNKGNLTLKTDIINKNTATGLGGGLYNGGGGVVTISASEFYNNRAGSGGGISNAGAQMGGAGATLDIKNDTMIDYNIATGVGGGINNTSGKVTMTGGSIYENSSGAGGGIYTVGGNVSLTYVYLYANFAQTGDGGGIFDNGGVLLKGGTVQGNTAKSGQGGGIFLVAATLTLAAGGGGDVLIGGGNTAKTGGGLYLNSGTTNFSGCDVGSNTATVKAAGVAYTTKATLNPKPPIPAADLTDNDDPGGQPVLV